MIQSTYLSVLIRIMHTISGLILDRVTFDTVS